MSKRALSKFVSKIGLLATAFIVAVIPPLQAAELEEITVVAERRTANLQDVPAAVTALSGEMVREGLVTGLEDVAVRVPNMKLNTFNIGEPQVYIRGIGNTSDSIGADPAVAIFLDEVYISRTGAASFDLYDLERIEVLRGPQGTLYGKNVAGGAVNVVTKKPSFESEGRVGLTYGNLDRIGVQAYINGPISDTVAGKVVASKRFRDGYAQNTTNGQDLDDQDNFSLRGQVLINATDNMEILFGADYSKDNTNGRCRTLGHLDPGLQSGLGAVFGAAEQAALIAEGADDIRTCTHTAEQNADKELFGFLAKVSVDMDWAKLESITAYRESQYDWIQDLGGIDSPPRLIGVFDRAEEESQQFSQELRLSGSSDRISWVTGLYYLRETAERNESFDDVFQFAPFRPFEGSVTFFQDGKVESFAGFADVKYGVLSNVIIGAGVRYSRDEKDIFQRAVDNINDGSPAAIPLGPGRPFEVSGSDSWSEWTPRVSLDWHPTDNIMAYFSFAKGFKSGAFPSQPTSAAAALNTLEPEEATNFELGTKTQWFNNRLRLNVSVFDLDYKNLQVFSLINLQLITENAEKASVRGVEMDFAAAITDNFTISGNFATMHAEYDDYVVTNPATGTTNDNSGNRMARAPRQSWTLAANYHQPLSNGNGSLAVNLGVSHVGASFTEANNDPRSLIDSYELVDGSVTYTSETEKWEISLWMKNMTDEDVPVHSILSTFGGAVRIYGEPRTYGVTASMRF